LKVARTLADLYAAEAISQAHLAEAVSYRMPGPGIQAPGRQPGVS